MPLFRCDTCCTQTLISMTTVQNIQKDLTVHKVRFVSVFGIICDFSMQAESTAAFLGLGAVRSQAGFILRSFLVQL